MGEPEATPTLLFPLSRTLFPPASLALLGVLENDEDILGLSLVRVSHAGLDECHWLENRGK